MHDRTPSLLGLLLCAQAGCDNPTPLEEGIAVTAEIDCQDSLFLDALELMCDLWPGMECNPSSGSDPSCSSYERQIFTGITVTPEPGGEANLANGRGAAGHSHADGILCSMRQLSPTIRGPLVSTAVVPLGIGNVQARQEIGFTQFDRVNHAFEGYRRLEFSVPVLGTFDAVTQPIRIAEHSEQIHLEAEYIENRPGVVGGRGPAIIDAYALDVSSEERSKDFVLRPPAFDVVTPIGVFEAQPEFQYKSNAAVTDSAFGDSTYVDVPDFGGTGRTFHLDDLYGTRPGLGYVLAPVDYGNYGEYQDKGWFSGLGLGTRSTRGTTEYWTPPASGDADRPDWDPYAPRGPEEALPSAYVSASATVKYPKNPEELLPDWINDVPYLMTPIAYITVTPTLEAGVAGQLGIGVQEGGYFTEEGEYQLYDHNVSAFGIQASTQATAAFRVDVRFVLRISVDAPWPVGVIDLVDIDETIPMPIGVESTDYGHLDWAAGIAHDQNAELDALVAFDTAYGTPQETEAFLDWCFAEEAEVPDEQIPETEPTPGDPSLLFPGNALWPCNICVAIDEQSEGEEFVIPVSYASVVQPATTPPTWSCDSQAKSGCMDACVSDLETGTLTKIHGPLYLASQALAHGDPANYEFFMSCL